MRSSLLLALAAASPALAQPTIIMMGLGGNDISPDGRTVLGGFYDAENIRGRVVLHNWFTGTVLPTDVQPLSGTMRMSADSSVISYEGPNIEAFNNSLNSIVYDAANPAASCSLATVWTAANGRQNLGVHTNGNRCGTSINTAADISDDGRYVVGGMYTAGSCGPFRAYIKDRVTGTITQLPFSFEGAPANTFADANRANAVNANGTIAVGYDNNNRPTGGRVRRPCVWRKNANNTWTQTILDRFGGEAYCVSADGTYVGGTDSTGAMIRWHFNGTTWDREVCANGQDRIPTSISGNGQVMVGDQFIWSPDINDGVTVNILDHMATLGTYYPEFAIGNPLGAAVQGVSDDGTKILVRAVDSRSLCLSTFSSAIISLDGGACVPPSLIFPPASDVNVAPSPGNYFYGVIVNMFASGSWPLNYQWQKLDSNGQWVDMIDDVYCNSNYGGADFDTKAVTTPQLRLGFLSDTWRGRYRCVVSNSCGSIVSPVARITNCPADYDASGGVDGDDVIAYFADWDASNSEADFDNHGGVDGDDIIAFFGNWDQSC